MYIQKKKITHVFSREMASRKMHVSFNFQSIQKATLDGARCFSAEIRIMHLKRLHECNRVNNWRNKKKRNEHRNGEQ